MIIAVACDPADVRRAPEHFAIGGNQGVIGASMDAYTQIAAPLCAQRPLAARSSRKCRGETADLRRVHFLWRASPGLTLLPLPCNQCPRPSFIVISPRALERPASTCSVVIFSNALSGIHFPAGCSAARGASFCRDARPWPLTIHAGRQSISREAAKTTEWIDPIRAQASIA